LRPRSRRRRRTEPDTIARIGAAYGPLNARLAAQLHGVDDRVLERMAAFLEAAERDTEDVIRGR
jgi:hypothetical protein